MTALLAKKKKSKASCHVDEQLQRRSGESHDEYSTKGFLQICDRDQCYCELLIEARECSSRGHHVFMHGRFKLTKSVLGGHFAPTPDSEQLATPESWSGVS